MAVIVDASAIGSIAFAEPDGEEIRAHLDEQTLIAPALIDFELISIAAKKVKRHPATLSQVVIGLQAAMNVPISRVQVPAVEVALLAMQTGLSAYDASYLWLARSRDLELVTLDRGLAKVADAL